MWLTSELAYAYFGKPVLPGVDPQDEITVLSGGFAALCANLYLAISNGMGRSVGKALTGLRLVTFAGPYPFKPGFARGLVRSALQAGPWMGAVMVAWGAHDRFAGTTIVQITDSAAWERWWRDRSISSAPCDAPNASLSNPRRIAIWKIAIAVVLHLFFVLVYMIVGAI